MNEQAYELAMAIQEWHKRRMDNLAALVDAPEDADLHLASGSAEDIVLTGKEARLVRTGVEIGMRMFEKLPFSLTENTNDEEE